MAHEGSIGQVLCRAPLSQRSTTMLGTKFTRFPPPFASTTAQTLTQQALQRLLHSLLQRLLQALQQLY